LYVVAKLDIATQLDRRSERGDHIEVVAGDFFESVPRADVHVLSYILHG
jgi:hypothetical protein